MGKNLNSKKWKKTSLKRYEAYISMPALGTKVINEVTGVELVTDKGSNFVISTLDGDISLCSANYIAKHFDFLDGTEIKADTLKKRAVMINDGLYLDWTKVISKSKSEPLWAYYCDNSELAESLSNRSSVKANVKEGYFLICKDSNGQPNSLSYSVENGKNFVYKYDLRAFPGISKSYTVQDLELTKPETLLDKVIKEKVDGITNSRELSLKELSSIFYNGLQITRDEYLNKVTHSGAPYISKLGKPLVDEEKRIVVCKNILKVNNLPFDYYCILQVSKTGICNITNTVDYKKSMGSLTRKATFETEKQSLKNKTEEEVSQILSSINFCDVYEDALKRIEYIALQTIGPQMKYLTMLVDKLREVNSEAEYELYDYHKKLDAKYPYRARLDANLLDKKCNLVICMTEELENDFPLVAVFGEDSNGKKIRRTNLCLDEAIMTVLSLYRSLDGYESMGNYIVKVVLNEIKTNPKYSDGRYKPNDNTLTLECCEITKNELVVASYNYLPIVTDKEDKLDDFGVIFDCNSSKNFIFTTSHESESKYQIKCSFSGLIYKILSFICGDITEMTNRTSKLYDLSKKYLENVDLDFIKDTAFNNYQIYNNNTDFIDVLDVPYISNRQERLYGRNSQKSIVYTINYNDVKLSLIESIKVCEVKDYKYKHENDGQKQEVVKVIYELKSEGILGNMTLKCHTLSINSNEAITKSSLKQKLDEFIELCRSAVNQIDELSTNPIAIASGFTNIITDYRSKESIFVSKYVQNCQLTILSNVRERNFSTNDEQKAGFPIGKEDFNGYTTHVIFDDKNRNSLKLVCCIWCKENMSFEVSLLNSSEKVWTENILFTNEERINFLHMIYTYRERFDDYVGSDLDTTNLIVRIKDLISKLLQETDTYINKDKNIIEDNNIKTDRVLNQPFTGRCKSTKKVAEKLMARGTPTEITLYQTFMDILSFDLIRPLSYPTMQAGKLTMSVLYGLNDATNAYTISMMNTRVHYGEYYFTYTIFDYNTNEVILEKEELAYTKVAASLLDVTQPGKTPKNNVVDFKRSATKFSCNIIKFFKSEYEKGEDIGRGILPTNFSSIKKFNTGLGDIDLEQLDNILSPIVQEEKLELVKENILRAIFYFSKGIHVCSKGKRELKMYTENNSIVFDENRLRVDFTYINSDYPDTDEGVSPFINIIVNKDGECGIQYVILCDEEEHEYVCELPLNYRDGNKQVSDFMDACDNLLNKLSNLSDEEELF